MHHLKAPRPTRAHVAVIIGLIAAVLGARCAIPHSGALIHGCYTTLAWSPRLLLHRVGAEPARCKPRPG